MILADFLQPDPNPAAKTKRIQTLLFTPCYALNTSPFVSRMDPFHLSLVCIFSKKSTKIMKIFKQKSTQNTKLSHLNNKIINSKTNKSLNIIFWNKVNYKKVRIRIPIRNSRIGSEDPDPVSYQNETALQHWHYKNDKMLRLDERDREGRRRVELKGIGRGGEEEKGKG